MFICGMIMFEFP